MNSLPIRVKTNVGYNASATPTSFSVLGENFNVDECVESWHRGGCVYFKLLTDDGSIYLIKQKERGRWELVNKVEKEGHV